MTLEERLEIINRKAKSNKTMELSKEMELKNETKEALRKVEELTERIEAIIILANKCIEEGIRFPSSSQTEGFGYGKGYNSYSFFADGIYHHVGLMDCQRGWWREGESPYKKVRYLGIENGGWYGVYDFYTNGTTTFYKHEENGEVKNADLRDIKAFLNEFDDFEIAFYKWIDSLSE